MTERFTGKYAAVVVDNQDPRGLARLKVQVPEVFGDETTGWAAACSPFSAQNAGLAAVPPVGSLVYVEWPAGDTSRVPIWSGGSWADGEGVPGAGPDVIVLVTPAGHKIELKDTSGSESIEVERGLGARRSCSTRTASRSRFGQPEDRADEQLGLDQRRRAAR